jgi:hypothetical protein
LRARPEPTQLEHISDASFLGKLLVLPANVRLDWKEIASYKHSSLFGLVISDKGKKFYNIGPWTSTLFPMPLASTKRYSLSSAKRSTFAGFLDFPPLSDDEDLEDDDGLADEGLADEGLADDGLADEGLAADDGLAAFFVPGPGVKVIKLFYFVIPGNSSSVCHWHFFRKA